MKLDFRSESFSHVLGFTIRHWRRQPVRVGVIVLFIVLATLAQVLAPRYAGDMVNAIAGGTVDDTHSLHDAVIAFLALSGLGVVGVIFRQLTFQNIIPFTKKMMSDIAADAFFRVQRFSSDWHANSFAGSTVRKITRGMWAVDLLNDTLLVALLPSLAMLMGATIMLGLQWPVMGLVIGLGSVFYIVVTVVMSLGYVAPAATLSNIWDTRLGGSLADAVSCNPVVKAFGAETREEKRFARVMKKWRGRTRRTWKRATLNGGLQGIMMVMMQAGILGTSLILWKQGTASAGDITFVLTMFFVMQGHLREIGMHIRNLQRSVNDMEEMVALHSQQLGVDDAPDAKPAAIDAGEIDFDHVTFKYASHDAPLYRDFSVKIAGGERVGLVGHSGSGKTTFVKLVQRLYDVTDGAIRIDGVNIADVGQASLRAQIAIVQQEPVLFHRTLAENIAYARPGATRAEIERAAMQASAHEFIMRLPKGYETLVGERGVKLSGGERQRVAIARAFLADAPILILDEATSSLDSESEVLIQEAMERLMVGRTTLVIAHRLSTVRALDRLLVFDAGKIVEEGSHQQLIGRKGGIYRRLFERQALELTKGFIVD